MLILYVFALKTNKEKIKTEFDNLDIDKLVSVSVDLSKLKRICMVN